METHHIADTTDRGDEWVYRTEPRPRAWEVLREAAPFLQADEREEALRHADWMEAETLKALRWRLRGTRTMAAGFVLGALIPLLCFLAYRSWPW